jgi:hypothetical protein
MPGISRLELIKPRIEIFEPMINAPDLDGGHSTEHLILPLSISGVRMTFFAKHPKLDEEQDFIANISIFDQFNNRHKLKRVIFRHTSRLSPFVAGN